MAQNFFDQFDEQPGVPGVQVKPADPMRGLDTRIKELEIAQKTQALQPKPPEGFRYTQDGLEPIPGGPADPKNKGRSGEEASRDETRIGNLRALERQIAEVRRLYAEGPGKTKGLKGLKDYVGTDANKAFDTAAAALADIGNAAFKVPGMGSQSDADAARFVAANQPSSGDRDVQIEQKLNALERRLAEAYAAAKVEPLGLVPALQPKGPRAPDLGLATGAQKFEPSDKASALATEMARASMSDEQINAALTAGGFSTLTPDSIGQVREYLKRNPGFKGVVPGAGTYKATSAFNRMAATPEATFLGNMGVAGTAGLPLLLTGQEGTDAFNAANEANPGSAMAGGAVGGLTATIGGGKLLAATKLAPWIAASPRAAALAGDLAYGSTYGFNTADEGQGLEGAAWGAGGALAGNAIGTGLTKAAGGAMRGVVNPSVDYLRSRGIPLTGGQMLGGWTKTLEDKATSIPVLGDLITKRRGEGLDAFGEAAFQEAGDAIGYPAKRTGAAGVDELKGAAGRAYDDATAGVSVPVDDRLRANVTTALDQAASLPPDLQRKFELAMSNRVLPVITEPQMSGEAYQQAVRGLKSYKAEATQPGFEADYRDLLSDAQEALTGAMTRHGGDRVVSGLQSADKTYRMTKVLEDAVKRARNGSRSGQVERFTPSQLTDAAEANRFSGTGAARPFYDLSKNGQEVLPSQVPDSGTPGRLLQYGLGAGLLGGAGGAEYGMSGDVSGTAKAASAIGALSLLNTKAGRKTLEKLLLDRFDPLRKAGDLTIKAAPYAGMFGRGAGATAGAYIGN